MAQHDGNAASSRLPGTQALQSKLKLFLGYGPMQLPADGRWLPGLGSRNEKEEREK
jgi:hypothetical protein